MFARHLIKDFF